MYKIAVYLIVAGSALVAFSLYVSGIEIVRLPENAPQPRYNCEDNSDTTKGHYKGVLTHCVPVKITRTM